MGGWSGTLVSFVALSSCMEATGERHLCSEFGCWPLTWILGCQKCGSTSLAKLMHTSRVACYANVTGVNEGRDAYFAKETHFWDRSRSGKHLNWTDFVNLYPKEWTGRCQSFVEATPNNLAYVEVAGAVFDAMPIAARYLSRFVAVLREPIGRDLSLYNHQRELGVDWLAACPACKLDAYEDMARCQIDIYRRIYDAQNDTEEIKMRHLRDRLGYISVWGSLFYEHIRAWTAFFERSNFIVVHFDSLTGENSTKSLSIIYTFVADIDPQSHPTEKEFLAGQLPHANAKDFPGKQTSVQCTTVDMLGAEIYDEWNEKLYTMLDDDRRRGRAPPVEPEFPRFGKIDCYR